jgi:hypothetical protein
MAQLHNTGIAGLRSMRGPAWPILASACAACAAHGLAQLGPARACVWPWPERARRGTRALQRRRHRRTGGGAGKGTAGPHRRVDGGAAKLAA